MELFFKILLWIPVAIYFDTLGMAAFHILGRWDISAPILNGVGAGIISWLIVSLYIDNI